MTIKKNIILNYRDTAPFFWKTDSKKFIPPDKDLATRGVTEMFEAASCLINIISDVTELHTEDIIVNIRMRKVYELQAAARRIFFALIHRRYPSVSRFYIARFLRIKKASVDIALNSFDVIVHQWGTEDHKIFRKIEKKFKESYFA